MSDRRVLLASLLSIICISLYSQAILRNSKSNRIAAVRSANSVSLESKVDISGTAIKFPQEDTVSIESESLRLEIGSSTGAIRAVILKRFRDSTKQNALQIKGDNPLVWIQDKSDSLKTEHVQVSENEAVISLSRNGVPAYELKYQLDEVSPLLKLSVQPKADLASQEALLFTNWLRGDELSSRQNRLEAYVTDLVDEKSKYKHLGAPWKGRKSVPRGTLLALSERYFCLAVKSPKLWGETNFYSLGNHGIEAAADISGIVGSEPIEIYFGPRDFFRLRAAGFNKVFPIGMISQIGLMLLALLSWIAKYTHSYGMAIILFSGLVTGVMAPFTLMGFRSMKRMQELKPQVDKLMAQHKSDPQKANKEVFALYKENKVSPLGGCLPMLLQMPIFIALFQAMSHFIDLRGTTFLKIQDLSLPDGLIHLPFQAPLVGNTINFLPIIMAGAMFLQTRASQKSMGTSADNPTAQMMNGPIMPVMFLFMFYQFPSGLVLYWLTNSIMGMLLYKLGNR